jgi:hypothetical protein
MLERDARGGTRYIEIIKAQFGVVSPDSLFYTKTKNVTLTA